MRVISGINKGTKLKTLEGDNTRPTLDRVKESLFSIIFSKRSDIKTVLDLFAGSGALGLEMLSRGADNVCFCDNSKQALQITTENVKKCKHESKTQIINLDYEKCLEKLNMQKSTFDLIILDPPYDKGMGIKAIEYIDKFELLNENGIVVLETSDKECIPEVLGKFVKADERKYGRVKIYMFMRKG